MNTPTLPIKPLVPISIVFSIVFGVATLVVFTQIHSVLLVLAF